MLIHTYVRDVCGTFVEVDVFCGLGRASFTYHYPVGEQPEAGDASGARGQSPLP